MGSRDILITALDLGTTTVRAIIARGQPDHGIQILGVGSLQSEGVRKSVIVDSAELVPIARAAIEAAERDAKVEVDSTFVSIGGGHVHSSNAAAVLNILDADNTIGSKHVHELVEKARANAAEKGREFLHAIPQEYRLDGHGGVQHPEGLEASRIEAAVHIISADRTLLENHGRVVNDAGFRVDGICLGVIADGHAVLSEQEKKDGVLLIDFGGGSASYAVYFNNTVYYTNVFAVGGDHITNDLALGLRLTAQEAEDVKCTFGRLHSMGGEDENVVKIKTAEKKTKALSRPDIEMIIDSRLEELLQFVADDVEQRQYRPLLASGVVCVGGSTNLHGFAAKAEKVFGMSVRIAAPALRTPESVHDPVDFYSSRHEYLHDTTFSTALGLVRYGYLSHLATQESSKGLLRRLFSL
jgi:cell division protein FtsA